MICLRGLSKSFRGRPALTGLSLEIAAGEIFGLLGHNGAGKSTTFGILLGQVYPDAGEAFVRGVSVQKQRGEALRGVGAIFETPGFYDYLSGRRNLELLVNLTAPVPRSEIDEVVEIVGLTERIRDPVRVYSHGMRQRLALAQALLPRPEVVLLDEPTEGLDPQGIHEMRAIIRRLAEESRMTVFLSSHLLAEVELLCDRVAILHQGKLVFEGRWNDFSKKADRHRVEVDDWPAAAAVLAGAGFETPAEGWIEADGRDISEAVRALVQAGVKVRAVERERATLEQFYLETIGAEP